MKTITTTLEGKTVHVRFLPRDEYHRERKASKIRAWYDFIYPPRGWAIGNHITVNQDAAGLRRLLAHEIGHVLDYDHSHWATPTTMNQTGLLRWFDPEGLLPLADQVLEEFHGD